MVLNFLVEFRKGLGATERETEETRLVKSEPRASPRAVEILAAFDVEL